MNAKAIGSALVFVAIFQFAASSAPADILTQVQSPEQAKQPPDKKPPDGQNPPPDKKGPAEPKLPLDNQPAVPPQTDIFAQTPTSVEAPRGFNPHMMGDFCTYFPLQIVRLSGFQIVTTFPDFSSNTTPISQTFNVRVPVSALGAFKVAEGDSPRPQDRLFLDYNFFEGLQNGPAGGVNTTTNIVVNGALAQSVRTFIPPVPGVDLNREVFGFEKTFFDGICSVELRMPMLQQQFVDGSAANLIGDLTVVGKLALLSNPVTGDVLTGGLALTVPTGGGLSTIDGTIYSTLFQPFVGYVWNFNNFFLQGFHSLVVPTDSRDVLLLFNDVSLNYWMYRGNATRIISAVVPALECHVTTPLNHRGATDPLVVPDLVVLTGGVHIGLFQNALLTAGVATPVTGPTPFTIEAIAQFNWRF